MKKQLIISTSIDLYPPQIEKYKSKNGVEC